MAVVVPAPVLDDAGAAVLEDAVELVGEFSVGVLVDILDELVVGFAEGDVVMVADVPVDVGVLSPGLVVGVREEDAQQLPHHRRLSHPRPRHPVRLELVVKPDLDPALLVDPDLVLVRAEVPHGVRQLRVPVKALVVEVEDIGVGDVLNVGQSQGDAFDEELLLVGGELLVSWSIWQEIPPLWRM